MWAATSVTKPRDFSLSGRYLFSAATRNPLDVPPCCNSGTTNARVRGLAPISGRQFRIASAVEFDQHGLSPRDLLHRPDCTAVRGQHGGGGRVPRRDPTRTRQTRVTAVVEEIGQREREIAQIPPELAVRESQAFLLGAYHAGWVGAEVPQRRHPPLTDDLMRVLADHAQHADDPPVVIAKWAVGERVIGLLGVPGALQEQQQAHIPGGLFGRQHPIDSRTDVVPDLRPHLTGGPSQRPRILAAQSVAPVRGVAEEGQLRSPRHPHREPG